MSPYAVRPEERPPLILVVDDEATQRLLTRDCLENEGFRVLEAEDGDAALAAMRSNPPDAVLLDIVMPGRDGFAVCEEIRGDASLSETPIILVTGREDDASVERAFAVQANDFITKPVIWPLLPHRLRFVLRADRLQKELRAALSAAEAAITAKTEFLANMSHELRTPLNAIIGFAEIIGSDAFIHFGREKIKEYAQDIHSSGSHLLSVINEILDIVKVESGTMRIKDECFALQEIAKHAVRFLESGAADKAITLVNRIDDSAPELRGEGHRIVQVLSNLLSNAIKFSAPGDTVELSFEFVDEGAIAVMVADTGPGIPAEDLPQIMEPFQQLDSSLARRQEGTGLGIPIAKAIARLHGGDLVYERRLQRLVDVTGEFSMMGAWHQADWRQSRGSASGAVPSSSTATSRFGCANFSPIPTGTFSST